MFDVNKIDYLRGTLELEESNSTFFIGMNEIQIPDCFLSFFGRGLELAYLFLKNKLKYISKWSKIAFLRHS